MNLLLDLEILGWLLVGLGIVEIVPVLVALGYGEPSLPYATSSAAALLYGVPIALTVRGQDRRMRSRDGFMIVSAAWVLASPESPRPTRTASSSFGEAAFSRATSVWATISCDD